MATRSGTPTVGAGAVLGGEFLLLFSGASNRLPQNQIKVHRRYPLTVPSNEPNAGGGSWNRRRGLG